MEKTDRLDSTRSLPPRVAATLAGIRDPLWDLINLPRRLSSKEVCESHPDQIQYWMHLVCCTSTHVPGRQFGDFFPRKVISAYRDDDGQRLPGMRNVTCHGRCHASTWCEVPPQDPTLTIEEQENYIRLKLLPAFSATMIQHFSVAVFAMQDGNHVSFGPSFASEFLSQVTIANQPLS